MTTTLINHNLVVNQIEDISDYQFFVASGSDIVFDGGGKGVGRRGDILRGVYVRPIFVDPIGAVKIKDGSGPLITVYDGGPSVVLFLGTNMEEGNRVLKESDLNTHFVGSLAQATEVLKGLATP